MLVPADHDPSTRLFGRLLLSPRRRTALESTLAVVAATWAIAMALGPVLQIRKIVEHRSSRSVSVAYFLVLLVGFVLWLAYGIAASNLALIVPNTIAAIVITATIIIALRYRRPRRPDHD